MHEMAVGAYREFFIDLFLLGVPDMLGHSEALPEALIALLDGVGVALAQEVLAFVVFGHLFVDGRVLEQVVDGAVGNLLNCRLDHLYNGREGLLELLGALVGGLELDRLVHLVATATAGRGLWLGGLGDSGALGASPATTSPTSAAGGSRGTGGSWLVSGQHVGGHCVVHIGRAGSREARLAHDEIDGGGKSEFKGEILWLMASDGNAALLLSVPGGRECK